MPPTEDPDVMLARVDQRLIAVERDVRDIKTTLQARQAPAPPWTSVAAVVVAAAALGVTLMQII